MSHREEPREVGGIYDSTRYIVTEPKKRVELTPEQREVGKTWVFHTEPERPQVVGEKPPSTTILKPPETYTTWIPFTGPERPYVTGAHAPRISDVTLVKVPPSVRAELRQRAYEERIQASRTFGISLQEKFLGVQTKLYDVELGLRELSIIQEQRVEGYEFVGKVGTELYFTPKEKKGIAESILSLPFPSYKGPSLMGIISPETKKIPLTATTSEFRRITGKTVHPLSGFAGLIASVESPVYILGRLAGFRTPRPPPTLTGGLIGKGLQAGVGWKSTELERTMAYGPEYAVGTIFGDIFVSYATGKAVSKVAKPLTTRVTAKTQSWLTEKYIEKGPLAWKGWKEKAVMKVTGARPYLARGEVVLPSLIEPVSLSQLQASQLSWELTQAPGVGGVWLRNIGLAPTKTKVLPHLIARGGAISIGYLRELGFEEPMWKRGLLPYVTQQQVTRMGITPHIPKMIGVTGKKGISQFLFGMGLTTIVKARPPTKVRQLTPVTLQPIRKRKEREVLFPKFWQPTLAYTREKFRPLTIEKPKAKERERLIPILRLPPFQIPRREVKHPILPIPKQIPKQIPVSPQIVTQIPSVPTSTPTIPTVPSPVIPLLRLPRGGRDVSRGRRGLFGLWFKREHPIKTPKEMWRTFSLTPRKAKRRKGQKRKKKRGREVKLFGF